MIVASYAAWEDGMRFLTLAMGMVLLGMFLALYHRAWRFALPKWTVRLVAFAVAANVAGVMYAIYSRLGHSLQWWTPTALCTFSLYLGSVFHLWRWFYSVDGRRVRHSMITSFVARELHREALALQQSQDSLRSLAEELESPPQSDRPPE